MESIYEPLAVLISGDFGAKAARQGAKAQRTQVGQEKGEGWKSMGISDCRFQI